MNVDRPIANANRRAAADSQPAGLPKPFYGGMAPLADVLYDQLEYLVRHGASDCPEGCSDCSRLERVKHWLLLPFDGYAS